MIRAENGGEIDAKGEATIEEVEAALKRWREMPVPEVEDPFWHYQIERMLCGVLEMLKARA